MDENMFKFSDTLNYVFAHIREGSQNQIEAIPRISDQKFVAYSDQINKNLNEDSGLILDFTSWDNTFYLALNSTIKSKQIFLIDGTKNGQIDLESLKYQFNQYPNGVLFLTNNSKFNKEYVLNGNVLIIDDSYILQVTSVFNNTDSRIFEY